MRRRNPFKKYFDPYEYVVFAVKVHQDPYHSHPILANKPEVHEQAVQDAMEDGLIIEMDDGWKLTPAGVIHRTQREWALERAYAEETTLGERPPRLPGETHGQYMRRVELLEMGEEIEGSGYREAVGIEEVRALENPAHNYFVFVPKRGKERILAAKQPIPAIREAESFGLPGSVVERMKGIRFGQVVHGEIGADENPKLRRTRRKGRRRVAGGKLPPKGVLQRTIARRKRNPAPGWGRCSSSPDQCLGDARWNADNLLTKLDVAAGFADRGDFESAVFMLGMALEYLGIIGYLAHLAEDKSVIAECDVIRSSISDAITSASDDDVKSLLAAIAGARRIKDALE